jgi:ribosomal protein S18 acetylase RimI-like enzyme
MTTPAPDTIRRATPEDAETVRMLVVELADHQDEGKYVLSTPDSWREMLSRDEVIVLLAERDGVPAGYVSALRRLHLWTGGDVIALDDLYVRGQFRDGRLGQKLMVELAGYAAPEQLTITWGVREDNVHAYRFYEWIGANLHTKVVASWNHTVYSALTD